MRKLQGRSRRRDTPLLKLNRDLTELALGPRRGRPTLSTRAGNALAEATGMSRRDGKSVFHGGIGVGVAKFARQRGVTSEGSAILGFLAFLALESYDAA